MYDFAYVGQYSDDVNLAIECVERTGGPLVDYGCATGGRVLLPVLEKGHNVIGVDQNNDMLTVARQRFSDKHLARTTLIRGDFTRTDLPMPAGTATCLLNTIVQAADRSSHRRMLETVFRNLVEGGIFLVGIKNDNLAAYDSKGSKSRERKVVTPYGELTFKASWDVCLSTRIKTYIFTCVLKTHTGAVLEESFRVPTFLVNADEFCLDAQEANFVVESLWGDPKKSPYDAETSLWQMFLLRKN